MEQYKKYENIKNNEYKSNEFKISVLTWNEES